MVELNEAGTFIRQIGASGSGDGQFSHPDAVEVDASGRIWVGDQGNNRIQRFNQNGEYVTQFGSLGAGTGQFSFSYPFGFAVGSNARIWIADRNNNRIQRWDTGVDPTAQYVSVEDDPTVELQTEGDLVTNMKGDEAGQHTYAIRGTISSPMSARGDRPPTNTTPAAA